MCAHGPVSTGPSRRLGAAAVTLDQAALIVGHPGHELLLHGWLESARPTVLILTDGSGTSGHSRLASSTALIERAGGRPGAIYGRISDREAYQAVLDLDLPLFVGLAEEMADLLVRGQVDSSSAIALKATTRPMTSAGSSSMRR